MTTFYPHCGGKTGKPIYMDRGAETGGLLEFRMYPPISGMSEDGRQAGWLGLHSMKPLRAPANKYIGVQSYSMSL